MNAYELADALRTIESGWATDLTLQESAKMLCQQADRIAELEKEKQILIQDVRNWYDDSHGGILDDEYFDKLLGKK